MCVRERLAARAGHLRLSRREQRLRRAEGVPSLDLRVADGDHEFVFPREALEPQEGEGQAGPRRLRSRGGRRHSRSFSPNSSSSSSRSRQVIRSASAAAAGQSRAARDVKKLPHLVLTGTLTQMCQTLPRTAAGASRPRAQMSQQLPPVFAAWFSMILLPIPRAKTTGERYNEREARTIVEIRDTLLIGGTLGAPMILRGRVRALTSAVIRSQPREVGCESTSLLALVVGKSDVGPGASSRPSVRSQLRSLDAPRRVERHKDAGLRSG